MLSLKLEYCIRRKDDAGRKCYNIDVTVFIHLGVPAGNVYAQDDKVATSTLTSLNKVASNIYYLTYIYTFISTK